MQANPVWYEPISFGDRVQACYKANNCTGPDDRAFFDWIQNFKHSLNGIVHHATANIFTTGGYEKEMATRKLPVINAIQSNNIEEGETPKTAVLANFDC